MPTETRALRVVTAMVFAAAGLLALVARSRLIEEHGRPGDGPLGPFLLFGFWALAHLGLVSIGLLRVRPDPHRPRRPCLALAFYLAQGAGHLGLWSWIALGGADPTGGIPYALVASSSFFVGPFVALAGLSSSRRGGVVLLGELVPALGLLATFLTGKVYA